MLSYPRDRFSDYNCRFVNRWIRLIFGQQIRKMLYFILYSWIIDTITEQGDKFFVVYVLLLGSFFFFLFHIGSIGV